MMKKTPHQLGDSLNKKNKCHLNIDLESQNNPNLNISQIEQKESLVMLRNHEPKIIPFKVDGNIFDIMTDSFEISANPHKTLNYLRIRYLESDPLIHTATNQEFNAKINEFSNIVASQSKIRLTYAGDLFNGPMIDEFIQKNPFDGIDLIITYDERKTVEIIHTNQKAVIVAYIYDVQLQFEHYPNLVERINQEITRIQNLHNNISLQLAAQKNDIERSIEFSVLNSSNEILREGLYNTIKKFSNNKCPQSKKELNELYNKLRQDYCPNVLDSELMYHIVYGTMNYCYDHDLHTDLSESDLAKKISNDLKDAIDRIPYKMYAVGKFDEEYIKQNKQNLEQQYKKFLLKCNTNQRTFPKRKLKAYKLDQEKYNGDKLPIEITNSKFMLNNLSDNQKIEDNGQVIKIIRESMMEKTDNFIKLKSENNQKIPQKSNTQSSCNGQVFSSLGYPKHHLKNHIGISPSLIAKTNLDNRIEPNQEISEPLNNPKINLNIHNDIGIDSFSYKKFHSIGETFIRLTMEYIFNQDNFQSRMKMLDSSPINEDISSFKNYFSFPEIKYIKSLVSSRNTERKLGMSLDGWCKPLRIAFEFQGIQHFVKSFDFKDSYYDLSLRQEDDKRKLEWANNLENPIMLLQIPSPDAVDFGGVQWRSYFNYIISAIKDHPLYEDPNHPLYHYDFDHIPELDYNSVLRLASKLCNYDAPTRVENYLKQVQTNLEDNISENYGYALTSEIRDKLGLTLDQIKSLASHHKMFKLISVPVYGADIVCLSSLDLWVDPDSKGIYMRNNNPNMKSNVQCVWMPKRVVSSDGELSWKHEKYIIGKKYAGLEVTLKESLDGSILKIFHEEKEITTIFLDGSIRRVGLNGRLFFDGDQITIGGKFADMQVRCVKYKFENPKNDKIYVYSIKENEELIKIVYPNLYYVSDRGNIYYNECQRYIDEKLRDQYVDVEPDYKNQTLKIYLLNRTTETPYKVIPMSPVIKTSPFKKVSDDGYISVDGGIYPVGTDFKGKNVTINECKDGDILKIFSDDGNLIKKIKKNRKKVSLTGTITWNGKKYAVSKWFTNQIVYIKENMGYLQVFSLKSGEFITNLDIKNYLI